MPELTSRPRKTKKGIMNVLFSDASRSPPPGPVSERRARRPPRRTHIGTSQSTHNGTAVAKALAAEAHK